MGLKLDINEVEVTPSRETVVWSAKTRAAVIKSYNDIVNTATNLINNELNSTDDYWEWILKTASIKDALVSSQSSTGSILQKLSGIIDATSINKIYYRKNNIDVLYSSKVKDLIGDKLLIRIFSYESYHRKIKREKIKSFNSIYNYSTYVTDGATHKYKDRYIYEQLELGKFVVIKRLENWENNELSNLIGNSIKLKNYDDIEVPEDLMNAYILEESDNGKIDDEDDDSTITNSVDLAKLRKLNQTILFHTPRVDGSSIIYSSQEIKINKLLIDNSTDIIIYSNFRERYLLDEVTSMLPVMVFKPLRYPRVHFSSDILVDQHFVENKNITPITSILINQENEKYIKNKKNYLHISEFLIEDYRNNKLTFNKLIRYAVTFKIIYDILQEYRIPFINNRHDAVIKFYSEEFLNVIIYAEYFNESTVHKIPTFFKTAAMFEVGKSELDLSILQDYLDTLNSIIPDELCDKVDEITDVHIVNVDLINEVTEYCKFYSKYHNILSVRHSSEDLLETLYPLIENYDEFPKKIKHL